MSEKVKLNTNLIYFENAYLTKKVFIFSKKKLNPKNYQAELYISK